MKKFFMIFAAAALMVTAFSACNKDPKPGEEEEPAAAVNLWAEALGDYTLEWYYNPNWEHGDGITDPAKQPTVGQKDGVWTVTVPDLTTGDWQAQLWIHPGKELKLDNTKRYRFKISIQSSTDGAIYFKLYHKGVDGEFCCHLDPRPTLNAGQEYVFIYEDITVLSANLDLLIDFAGHAASTSFTIKDIVLEEILDEIVIAVE